MVSSGVFLKCVFGHQQIFFVPEGIIMGLDSIEISSVETDLDNPTGKKLMLQSPYINQWMSELA